MNRIRFWSAVTALIFVVVAIPVVRNQVRVYRGRQIRSAEAFRRQMSAAESRIREIRAAEARARQLMPAEVGVRYRLFEMLQPVALRNCRLQRFGEAHDGGYLMCGNLLGRVQSGYSYGIAGYDKWGCDVSTTLEVKVHQYDCFDTRQPACPDGDTVFHAECVAGTTRIAEGRFFDTIEHQLARNGDTGRRLVLKIDVEGAEWASFIQAPDRVLKQIDQMAVEFHRVQDEDDKYLLVVHRLKQFFDIAHIHFNNFSCVQNLGPFPAWAYEVLFVRKGLGVVDPSLKPTVLHPLDAPNSPSVADCQPKAP